MVIQGLEEDWLTKSKGMMGLQLLTFDDFAKEISGVRDPMPTPLLRYILHEQIQHLHREGAFHSLDESVRFESLSEALIDLFRDLHAQGIPLELKDQGTNGDIMKIFNRYEDFLNIHGLYDLGMVYCQALEVLKSYKFQLPLIMIYGFDSFRPHEWNLIECLIEAGYTLEIFHPTSRLASKTLSAQTFEKFKTLSIPMPSIRLKTQKNSVKFIHGSQPLDLYRSILLDAMTKEDLSRTAIYTSSEQVRSEIRMVAESMGVPISSPIQSFDLDQSLLARDFKDFFLCLELGKQGFLNFLRSHYFKKWDGARHLINILETMRFEDVQSLYRYVNGVQKIQLDAEDHQLLLNHLHYFMELARARKDQNFKELIEESQAILHEIPEEDLLREDEGLHMAMLEVLEELQIYTMYLSSISRENFIKLFYELLNRRGNDIFMYDGLDLLTLEQGIDKKYECIYVADTSVDWPKKNSTSFMNSPSLQGELMSCGYLPVKDDFNYLRGKGQIESLLAAGDEVIFSWVGSEEEYSLVLEDFFAMDEFEKISISAYPMTSMTENSLTLQSHRRKMRESRNKMDSVYHGALDGASKGALTNQIKSRPLSATLLDRFVRCPFSAYMERFLLPELKMETPESMIPIETGNIYHRVLEETRGEITDPMEISQILERHYRSSLLSQGKTEAERKIEMDYLKTHLMDFIEEDQRRMQDQKKDLGFKTYAVEQRFQGEIQGLTWRGSIDRIDRNEAGDEILIDYKKSSVPTIDDVKEGRVWQLVIYAHIRRGLGHSVQGLTYGNIEKHEFRSYLRNKDRIQQYGRLNRKTDLSEEDFEAFFEISLHQLDTLISKLYQMEFNPNPINSNQCVSCLYRNVCRREEAPWLS